jgi:tetrapyrrole methylase family protein/MazG family protein
MDAAQQFAKLVEIMARLRSPEGCPWDREQTHQSLRPYLLEETYEVLEALDQQQNGELCQELGDLLLQVVFHAQIAGEASSFTLSEVIAGITEKLIRRHPHVFGEVTQSARLEDGNLTQLKVKVNSASEQRSLWEKLKKAEGKNSVIDGVPAALPALQRAQRLQQKAGAAGFDWKDVDEVIEKFNSELVELQHARRDGYASQLEDEFGDVLFSLVAVGRWLGLNAEDALRQACNKFSRRFRLVENKLAAAGEHFENVSPEKIEALWEMAKAEI